MKRFAAATGTIAVIVAAVLWAPAHSAEDQLTVKYSDVTEAAGITFKHDNARSEERYLIETMGAGAAWLDYDNDGFLDLYLVNSAATKAYRPQRPLAGALYHNNQDGTFTDVTDKAGVSAAGLFGMGVAVADYDNDGFADLYVAGYGRSILYRNKGDGTFTGETSKAGVENLGKWASSAGWLDYDHDGKLDLIIANYLDFTPEKNLICVEGGHRAYCHPNKYGGQTPTLYRNKGDGTFVRFLGERGQIDFRAEFFNLFNRVNLGQPTGSLTSTQFGRSTTALGGRNVQFGLRLQF